MLQLAADREKYGDGWSVPNKFYERSSMMVFDICAAFGQDPFKWWATLSPGQQAALMVWRRIRADRERDH